MPKSQQYLIAAILALFAFVLFVFRGDLFILENRPGVSDFLQNIVQPYGMGISLMLFAYLLGKSISKKWLFVSIFVLWEAFYFVMLHFGGNFLPSDVKLASWFQHIKKIGIENRSMIQFQEETAQYDTELFYTLKPGESRFKSFEFDTKYSNNILGVRDDEQSLDFPEILFLGDSFTMGWGVEQEEAFPQVFEKLSKFKTLNSGISSYGTAREFRLMNRIQTDSLKAIVIQYHDTDLEENNYFIKNGKLGSRTQADFDGQVKYNKKFLTYYPFKYLQTALLNKIASIQAKGASTGAEAALQGVFVQYPDYLKEFYLIVDQIKAVKNVPIIVTYTGSFLTQKEILDSFEKYAKENNIENVYFVNMADQLNHDDYYFYDDHLNKDGHVKIAESVFSKIKEIL